MEFHVNAEQFDTWITEQQKTHEIYTPKCFPGGNTFSDVDCTRYGKVNSISEIVFEQKSEYSFKEVLTPISQTLFFFTEDQCREADPPKKGAILFLRSCDLHALKRLDDMYLHNGPADYYYKRIRDNIKIVLIGCKHSFESCFCVSMGTNISENYDMSINVADGVYELNCKDSSWNQFFLDLGASRHLVVPDQVHENQTVVKIPKNLTADVARASMWEQYNKRCINCGRCNFVCPTCTCFTMQDLYYTENAKVGERRRVWASCMVDGFTDVAGGGSYRKKNGERMRFKVLHKVLDYKQRNGYHMCVGCGEYAINCPNRAWTRSEQKYYRLTLLGRTGKKNPRLGEDFIKWADVDSIIRIILNTYDYVKEYIDPNAPGGKEHIGYIVDRTGFEEFKRWALKDVVLPGKAEVVTPMYWKGIKY